MPIPKQKRTKVDYASNPKRFVGTRIAKDFGEHGIYFGTISDASVEDDQVLWTVVYDDGDHEDYDEEDLKKAQKFYESNKEKDERKLPKENVEKETNVVEQALTGSVPANGDVPEATKESKELGAAPPSAAEESVTVGRKDQQQQQQQQQQHSNSNA